MTFEQSNQETHFNHFLDTLEAKAIAKHLFEKYKQNQNKTIEKDDTKFMMIQAYKCIKKDVEPSNKDQDGYHKILDRNGDGIVTLQDFEELAIKYLVSPPDFQQHQNNQQKQQQQKQQQQQQQQQQSELQFQQNQQKQNQNQNQTKEKKQIQIKQDDKTINNIPEKQEDNSNKKNNNKTFRQKAISSIQGSNPIQVRFNIHNRPQSLDMSHYEQQLKAAKKLFNRFDTQNQGYIIEDEVYPLLKAHYRKLGIDHSPTREEIKDWIKSADSNNDGRISYDEYEYVVKTSLTQCGTEPKSQLSQ